MAQINVDSLPKDPLNSIWKYPAPVRNYDLSFLLQEDSCYDFKITGIKSLPEGYIMQARTCVDSLNVRAYLVTPKGYPIKSVQKRIKRGKNYRLHLRRYFLLPARVGIEAGSTVDVMLGNKVISINENGEYTYLFTSLDMEGLYQIKSRDVAVKKQKFQKEEANLKNNILPFLEYVSWGVQPNNLLDIIDTTQVKRSLRKYGKHYWSRHPSDIYHPERRYEWQLDHPVEKHDWRYWDSINPKNYDEVFWRMLKRDYHLPLTVQDVCRDSLYSSIKLKLLYYSKPNIYTVQVAWKIPNVNKTYVAILNIQRKEDAYKVIGFNRAYGGYHLYLEEGNERFVPYE
ncbi:MAG: hypothetical protein LBV02_07285 [Bacteroidales bacterium]|nr:hypothetical protein [Bacteroidales bacterium]